MASEPNALVEAGPWSTQYANPRRTAASPVPATASGTVLWSADLGGPSLGISTSTDGRVLVATPGALVTFRPGGERVGSAPSHAVCEPTLLTDGRMVVPEHDRTTARLTIRDQRTGGILAAIPDWAFTPAVSADGLVIFPYRSLSWSSDLLAFDLDGKLQWSTPLTSPDVQVLPLLLDDWIVIAECRHLKAYDHRGRLGWVAGRDGFRTTEPEASRQPRSKESDIDRIALIDGDRIFVSYGAGGYYVFDPGAETVDRIPSQLHGRAWALPFVDGRTEVITKVGRGLVGMYGLDGQTVWRHGTVDDPFDVVADKDGKVVLSVGITQREWDKREWSAASRRQMLDLCYVRCLSPDGEELFTWQPDVRFRSHLAIGAGGEIYAAADGKLWAIG
ncbi:MAG: PQQ-binding-like beta-propeller repeat protein [Actinomycetota bacterium]